MKDVIVPIDHSSDAASAATRAIARYRREAARIHLLNVQRPLPRHISQFVGGADLRDFHHESGLRVMQQAIAMLDEAGIPHRDHVLVGKPAESIVQFSEERPGAELLLDAGPDSVFSVLGLGSIGSQVRRLLTGSAPVTPAEQSPGA
jgi:nucleotide-binding universal stress UspA family protein